MFCSFMYAHLFVFLFFMFLNSYKCIHQSLEDNNRCPKCNYVVDNIDHLYPNFLGEL